MFLFWYFDLFYFFAQFLAKKSGLKILFFSIFLQFLMHFLVPSGTKFITNMDWEGEKKIQCNICWSSEMSARDNFPILFETNKNL